MAVSVELDGEGISFEREVQEQTAVQIMEVTMTDQRTEDRNEGENMVEVTVSGEGISFERSVPERIAVKVIEIAMDGRAAGTVEDDQGGDEDTAEEGMESLPESFFDRLTSRQEAYVKILLESEDWISNEDIRRKLSEEYDLESGGSQAMAGIRSGFTRKYGDDFKLDDERWRGGQKEYRLNQDGRFEEELRERLD